MDQSQKERPGNSSIAIVAVALSGLLIRLIPLLHSRLPDGSLLFSQHDNYYHLRRAALYAADFPRLPALDYYLSFPNGAECPWPPLYDLFIALLSLLSGSARPDLHTIEMISAVLPPVLACLSVIPLYAIVMTLFRNRTAAVAACILLVLMPGLLNYSHIAAGDHHAAEVFLSLCFLRFALRATDLRGDDNRHDGAAVASGLFLALGLCVWQGQVLYFGIWSLFLVITMLLHRKNTPALRRLMRAHTLLSAAAGLFILAVRMLFPRATEQSLFSFSFFSYFQPLLIAALWLAAFWFYLFLSARGFRRSALSAIPVIVLFIIPFTRFGGDIREGIIHMFRPDPWMESIQETQPAFTAERVRMSVTLGQAGPYLYLVPWLYMLWQLSPLLTALWSGATALRRRRQTLPVQEDNAGYALLAAAGIVLSAPALFQSRWDNSLTPYIAIALGLSFQKLWLFCRRRIAVPGIAAASAALVTALVLLPLYPATKQILSQPTPLQTRNILEPLVWLRNQTPPAGNLWDQKKKPAYGVFAFWDTGHYLQYISQRPAVIGNFGFLLRGDNFIDSLTIWSCGTEQELAGYCEKYGVRYLLLSDPRTLFNNSMSYFLGEKKSFFQPGNRQFFTLAIPRLMEYDGSAGPYGDAFGRFRLVFESSRLSQPYYHPNRIQQYKIYEFVNGARLTVHSAPGKKVRLTARFSVFGRRTFDWHTEAFTDRSGTAVFSAAYPTKQGNPGTPVQPLSAYTVSDGVRSQSVHVTEEDTRGRTIDIRLR